MLIALENLCNQRKFLSEMEKVHNKPKDIFQRKDLQIKCSEKGRDCSVKKRSHFKKYHLRKKYHGEPKKRIFRKIKWKFLRRKKFKGKISKVCFMCRKPGHFAKNCPKKEKVANLLEQAQIHVEDTPFSNVESLFLLDDEYSP